MTVLFDGIGAPCRTPIPEDKRVEVNRAAIGFPPMVGEHLARQPLPKKALSFRLLPEFRADHAGD